MTNKIKKILVITSGGDAPGMNAAIRAIVRTAIHYGIEVYGSGLGYQGLVERDIFPLSVDFVANSIQRGGTILKTARYPEFHKPEVRRIAANVLKEFGIDALIVLGGDGSFRGAALLEKEFDLKVMGIPCTIDNDIRGTDYTIGFDTACNTALQAIDRIRDTAFSHNRNFLVEVMGRASGFLAVTVGIAGGAEFILIPEDPLSSEQLAARINARRRKKLGSIIVVAEADQAGRSFKLAEDLKKLVGMEYKVCILGHTQRGGSPTVEDRKVASLMGSRAVDALLEGKSQKMLGMRKGELVLAEFPDPSLGARQFDDPELIRINQVLCDI
jgi:6-phosphofructokinase 1